MGCFTKKPHTTHQWMQKAKGAHHPFAKRGQVGRHNTETSHVPSSPPGTNPTAAEYKTPREVLDKIAAR